MQKEPFREYLMDIHQVTPKVAQNYLSRLKRVERDFGVDVDLLKLSHADLEEMIVAIRIKAAKMSISPNVMADLANSLRRYHDFLRGTVMTRRAKPR